MPSPTRLDNEWALVVPYFGRHDDNDKFDVKDINEIGCPYENADAENADVEIEDFRAFALAILVPVKQLDLYRDALFEGDVQIDNVLFVRRIQSGEAELESPGSSNGGESKFKVMAKGTELLVCLDQIQAYPSHLERLVMVQYLWRFNESEEPIQDNNGKCSDETSIQDNNGKCSEELICHLTFLATYSPIGMSKLPFWNDVKFDRMSDAMKSMWMFATLASLHEREVSFDNLDACLKDAGEANRNFTVDTLYNYATDLVKLGVWWNLYIRFLSTSEASKRAAERDSNIYYSAMQHTNDPDILPLLNRAFTFTFIFSAIEKFLPNQNVEVSSDRFDQWQKVSEKMSNFEELKTTTGVFKKD
eukprot:GHVS01068951.1.p1 GENE.GHVS01068951.1~~GHVS01068951.1.p1  ORF type:complete len:380 (+),score=38.57 GHVS01068951.1:59-1141(+)